MQIYKNGVLVYNPIDNTGSSDLASLGAQYAKGRLDTLDGRFNGYYTKSEILDLLTGVAATRIVPILPDEPEANTYYLVGNDLDGYTLHYYDTELEHAVVGSYELDLSSAIPQRDVMPDAGVGLNGKVIQYTGTTQSQYVRGKWYLCANQPYYGWLNTTTATTVFTTTDAPTSGTYLYDETGERLTVNVASVSGTSMTDTSDGTYTRNTSADKTQWQWNDLADGAVSSMWNANATPSRAIASDANGKLVASGATAEELGRLSGVTENVQQQLDNIETDNLKSGVLATTIGSSPVDTKIPSEKAVSDFAVKKTTEASKVYGTNSSGAASNYALSTALSSSSTDAQVPTAKSVVGYSVAKTSDANKVYGSSNNFDRATSISSSSTDTQIPTAKSVYNFAVAKTTTADRIYATTTGGAANLMGFSGTYNSTANNQLFTRAGAYNLYSAVRNGEQAMVFCGNFTRNSTQSVSSNTSTRISLTASDIYRTNLVSLASNAVRVLVAGTYWVRFIGRLADTAGATRAWYLGGGNTSSMADDQMGGVWSYTYNRHKAEATYLKYCAANEYLAPWVYIDSTSGTLNYMTVEVFRLNNK